MLEIKNISKSFNGNLVLDNVSFKVEDGEIYGLIGANGAGKTTLFNIITRILQEDNGEVLVDGKKISFVNDIAGKIGYIIDIPAFFDYMTAGEYLEFIASPLNLGKAEFETRARQVLNQVGLSEVYNKRLKQFSRGMRQRMGIASGLIGNAKIIIMDEPSSALDPAGRHDVLKIIENLKNEGKTIILSTHILSDVEKVCDRLGILSGHKIVTQGTVYEILHKYQDNEISVTCSHENALKIKEYAQKLQGFTGAELKNRGIDITFEEHFKEQIFKSLLNCKIPFDGIKFKEKSIEDVFLGQGSNNESF